ncbi:hypothetical protein AUJ14_03515 [Candidatus Micrarchaeota archaeon CG1_02_55_22]|nr:MAG: hypothetical protein AUJ14_03515 [Candidatus Micrarchaeota archaeon CG1_02_55_22]
MKPPEKASFKKTVTRGDVDAFVAVSGDDNPLHVDEAYAAKTKFGHRVAHGMLVASFFSQCVGKRLGTDGVLYLGQTLNFRLPVYIGDELEIEFSLKSYSESTRTASYSTRATRGGTVCVDGEARVAFL